MGCVGRTGCAWGSAAGAGALEKVKGGFGPAAWPPWRLPVCAGAFPISVGLDWLRAVTGPGGLAILMFCCGREPALPRCPVDLWGFTFWRAFCQKVCCRSQSSPSGDEAGVPFPFPRRRLLW